MATEYDPGKPSLAVFETERKVRGCATPTPWAAGTRTTLEPEPPMAWEAPPRSRSRQVETAGSTSHHRGTARYRWSSGHRFALPPIGRGGHWDVGRTASCVPSWRRRPLNGFRPNRGCHTALTEFDLMTSRPDNIPLGVDMREHDNRFLRLGQLLRAGYLQIATWTPKAAWSVPSSVYRPSGQVRRTRPLARLQPWQQAEAQSGVR